MKSILVTGSNGLLGQKLVYKLRNREDIKLIATARGENRLVEKSGYEYVTMDTTQADEVIRIVAHFQPDSIIHTAAQTNVDACESDQEGAWLANVVAVENLVNAIQLKSPQTQLIHLSTDFIFDGENGPYKEEDAPNPISYYGMTKYEAEKRLYASTIHWAILRTIIVYGITDNMSRSNIVLWAKGALEKGQPLNVVNDQFRSPTLAEDLADACISAALKGAQGIYNVSGKDFMSIIELVYRVADFYGLDKSLVKPVSSSTLNQPAKRPPRTGFILDKAYRDLDYRPHSFEEGIQLVDSQVKQFSK
ncbi:MAG: SDR family oxidoreductase [Bacteroidia bacterium]|nr:SDR family oxidoreductase [Bacteroidia bacterium]